MRRGRSINSCTRSDVGLAARTKKFTIGRSTGVAMMSSASVSALCRPEGPYRWSSSCEVTCFENGPRISAPTAPPSAMYSSFSCSCSFQNSGIRSGFFSRTSSRRWRLVATSRSAGGRKSNGRHDTRPPSMSSVASATSPVAPRSSAMARFLRQTSSRSSSGNSARLPSFSLQIASSAAARAFCSSSSRFFSSSFSSLCSARRCPFDFRCTSRLWLRAKFESSAVKR
mmetsp:Transcript_14705/g.47968  ORF Transcript_14705/g.47968 Transcript_14705/m.47968 type:complete len:227 (-) Transcript_14705:146-826(-)